MMNSIRSGLLLCLSTLLYCDLSTAADPLWLSADPPEARKGMRSSHGGPVEVRKGVYYKRLWLRQGGLPMEAAYLSSTGEAPMLQLLDSEGKASEKSFEREGEGGFFNVSFAMPAEGFYNAYAAQARLEGGMRVMTLAKAEVLKHSCREGHDNVQEKMPPRRNREIPLEIVRERKSKENFHTRVGYGDQISFLVLRNGVPQPGVELALTSGQGWRKLGLSDAEGRVSYTMIRDYYPPWHLFEKRHAQPYMVQADYTSREAGVLDGEPYKGTRYIASFSGYYYPSANDYESYAYGLSLGLFALVTTGLGILRFRRRRTRPYREVRFHE